jgi:hypothetical protein
VLQNIADAVARRYERVGKDLKFGETQYSVVEEGHGSGHYLCRAPALAGALNNAAEARLLNIVFLSKRDFG